MGLQIRLQSNRVTGIQFAIAEGSKLANRSEQISVINASINQQEAGVYAFYFTQILNVS